MTAATVVASSPIATANDPSFAGSQACATCHARAYQEWSGSQHDLAMQEATAATVLGDFDGATFTAQGITSRFFTKDGGYYVNTEGPDGELRDYRIHYTFGVHPLQQYLIAFPDGRLQAFGVAWDARPQAKGGQRWFHLYADERIAPDDVLHWTGVNQNWNYMCADCHSTNLRRNFDLEKNRFETTWSEIDVSCEACHGPGSKHVAWAEAGTPTGASNGLATAFNDRKNIQWTLKDGAVIAARSAPPATFRAEVESCARCHSRHSPLGDAVEDGKPILDNYRIALLSEDLYHADGQIKDEVYVYGSFLQSKMYRAGVTCSDCHDPHSLELRAKGNALCTRCHLPEAFDSPAHHFHTAGAPGSRCVDCHAPETTYMVVDPRRDHSFRVPRPDLSVKIGIPNACSGCHDDKTAAWAAERVAAWHGPSRKQSPHFGEALTAAREGVPAAERQLMEIAFDAGQPAIVRATALDTLGQNLNQDSFPAIQQGLLAEDAIVRLAALGTLERLDPRARFQLVFPLIEDPVRAVRLEAARLMAPVPPDTLPAEARETLATAFAEYERAQKTVTDRPEGLMTLANFYRDRGDTQRAEAAYREAMARHPWFGPAFVNLADLYRTLGQDKQGEEVLRAALPTALAKADMLYAYGLVLIRNQRYAQATKRLGEAAALRPDNARYSFAYALALQKIGNTRKASTVLMAAHEQHPNNRDILFTLAILSRDRGDVETAAQYANALLRLAPDDPEARQLLESLQAQ